MTTGSPLNLRSKCTFSNKPQTVSTDCGYLRLHHSSEIKKPRVLMLKRQQSKVTKKKKKIDILQHKNPITPASTRFKIRQINNSTQWKMVIFERAKLSTSKITVYIFEYLPWFWSYLSVLLSPQTTLCGGYYQVPILQMRTVRSRDLTANIKVEPRSKPR